jgi:hypothetical protein
VGPPEGGPLRFCGFIEAGLSRVEIACRRDKSGAFEFTEHQKVLAAGDEELGASASGAVEENVILCIATDFNLALGFDRNVSAED